MAGAGVESAVERKEPAWFRLLLCGLLVLLAALFACNEIADYDFWWHLRTGELIWERGTTPETDWYSFTEPDRPWIDVHWGFQVLLAKIYGWCGVEGVTALKCLLAAGTTATALSAYRREWSVWPQFWIGLTALVVMSSRFYERPEMFTLLFTSAYMAVLLHADRRPGLLWLLPAVQLCWANVQGLFIFGPILLGMYWVQLVLTRLLRGGSGPSGAESSWRGPSAALLAAVTALAAAACVASPYGLWNVSFVWELWEKMDPQRGEFYRRYIGELRDVPSFLREGGWRAGTVWALFGLMGLGAAGVLLRWREITLRGEAFRILPVLAFSWLGLQAIRNGSHFALVVGMATAWNFGLSFPAKRRRFAWRAAVATAACLLVATTFVGGRWGEAMGAHRRFGIGFHPEQFSFEAMDVCAAPGMPDRALVFHLGHAASYIHRCGPERKVFMDPRLEVHTQQMLRRYKDLNEAFDTGGDWQRTLDMYGIDLVVASSEHSLGVQAALFCNPYWKCLHWDEAAAVFLRATRPTPEGAREFDFREAIWRPPGRVGPDDRKPSPFSPFARRASRESRVADHLLRLAQAIAGHPNRRDDVLRRVLWSAAKASLRVEGDGVAPFDRRVYGVALLMLAEVESARTRSAAPFEPYVENLRGLGAGTLRAIVRESPAEVTVAYYYQELLANQGAVDASVPILERLSRRWPANAAQVKVFAGLPTLLAERRARLESSSGKIPQDLRDWKDFAALRNAGRLGELLDRVEANPGALAGLSLEQRIEAVRWGASVGRAVVLEDFAHKAAEEAGGWVVRRDSFHDLVDLRLFEVVLEACRSGRMGGEPIRCGREGVDCELLTLTQRLLEGDRAGFKAALRRAEELGPDPRQRRRLTHLRELLVHESNDH